MQEKIGPSISSGRSAPLLKAAAVVVVDTESAGPGDIVGLEESAASDRGVCLPPSSVQHLHLEPLNRAVHPLGYVVRFPFDRSDPRAHTINLGLEYLFDEGLHTPRKRKKGQTREHRYASYKYGDV